MKSIKTEKSLENLNLYNQLGAANSCAFPLKAMRMQTEMELRMFKQNEYIYHTMREAALKNQPMQMMAEPIEEGIKSLFRKK